MSQTTFSLQRFSHCTLCNSGFLQFTQVWESYNSAERLCWLHSHLPNHMTLIQYLDNPVCVFVWVHLLSCSEFEHPLIVWNVSVSVCFFISHVLVNHLSISGFYNKFSLFNLIYKEKKEYWVVENSYKRCNFPPFNQKNIFGTVKLHNPDPFVYWFPCGCQHS